MQKVISFNKSGYEPFLDFIKAYAIICVLIGHTIPYIHESGLSLFVDMQVPLFVLVQVFHVYKKDVYKLDIKKLFFRIFLPFFTIQMIPLAHGLLTNDDTKQFIIKYLIRGGIGPGSYYPWLYLQLAIIIPLVKPFFNRGSMLTKIIVVILICEGFEVLESLVNVPPLVHRLLPIRYFFLIFLGWTWVETGIVINWKTIILSLFSLASVVYFEYFNSELEPWFYDTSWNIHRWPCYLYVSMLLCTFLYFLYSHIMNKAFILKYVNKVAKSSYEIFLLQMVAIEMIPSICLTKSSIINYLIWLLIIFSVSIIGGFYFHKVYSNLIRTSKPVVYV